MHTRRITSGAAAAALALLASACSDRLTAPAAHPGAPSFSTSAAGLTLVPNSVRYSDTGAKPATGRAGSAALDALALVGKDGYTELDLRARPADPSREGTGTIAHAQAKVYDGDGALRITRNARGGEPLRFGGLPRGTRYDVQANVTGIDAHRTDVVEVSTTSRLRPDVSVTAGVGSGPVHPGSPLVVAGQVAELNGDLGAEADCVLLVDGQAVDQARRIWVDAGGQVLCLFTTTLTVEGTHTLTVRVDGVNPGDWDTANNTSSVQVEVRARQVPVYFSLSARSEDYWARNYWRTLYYNWGYGTEEVQEQTEEGIRHEVFAQGSIGRGYAGPLTFRVVESGNGELLQDDAWTEEDPGWFVRCSARYNLAQGTSLHFCSYFGYSSNVQFFRYSGPVTYHSRGYYREWDEYSGEEYVYHWNYEDRRTTGPAEVLTSYRLRISLLSGDEETAMDAATEMTPFTEEYNEPDWCSGAGDPEWGWYDEYCYGSQGRVSGWYGYGSYVREGDPQP